MAIEHVIELFDLDGSSNVGLEEVEYIEIPEGWNITVGFSRPWDHQLSGIGSALQPMQPKRQYRVVKILETGQIKSVKIRE
ncbi:MAG: hypothetical protein P1U67_05645 [Alcanivoracaceae bacterium]|nr:hypothetical protein [Alcanivoracaceae bacterium]